MASRTCCAFPYCEEPQDEDLKSGLCEAHTAKWLRSPEWREATQDEKVRLWMSLRIEKSAMREVAKYRRKWAKRVSKEEGEATP